MYGRAHQWLIMGPSKADWWNGTDTECAPENIQTALESTILADLLPLS